VAYATLALWARSRDRPTVAARLAAALARARSALNEAGTRARPRFSRATSAPPSWPFTTTTGSSAAASRWRATAGVGDYKPLPAAVARARRGSANPRALAGRHREPLDGGWSGRVSRRPSAIPWRPRRKADGADPLLLHYEAGGCNCRRTCTARRPPCSPFLSPPESYGWRVLLEQRPRAQSIGHAIRPGRARWSSSPLASGRSPGSVAPTDASAMG
jgi:hypothetical protein